MSKLRILLDECLDRRLVSEITGCFVKTVPDMGWAGLKNGELLIKAQKEFDIFITNDQNLSFQQNLTKFQLAVLVLCPSTNRLEDLRANLKIGLKKITTIKVGEVLFIK